MDRQIHEWMYEWMHKWRTGENKWIDKNRLIDTQVDRRSYDK